MPRFGSKARVRAYRGALHPSGGSGTPQCTLFVRIPKQLARSPATPRSAASRFSFCVDPPCANTPKREVGERSCLNRTPGRNVAPLSVCHCPSRRVPDMMDRTHLHTHTHTEMPSTALHVLIEWLNADSGWYAGRRCWSHITTCVPANSCLCMATSTRARPHGARMCTHGRARVAPAWNLIGASGP